MHDEFTSSNSREVENLYCYENLDDYDDYDACDTDENNDGNGCVLEELAHAFFRLFLIKRVNAMGKTWFSLRRHRRGRNNRCCAAC